MKTDLISIQKEHLAFLKDMRERKGIAETVDSRIYLDNCIMLLEVELYPRKNKFDDVLFNKNLVPNIEKMGFDTNQASVLACLLSNNRPIGVGELSVKTNIDRCKAYRTINKLLEYGMIVKSGIGLARYVLKDKKTPFQPMIEYISLQKDRQIDKLSKFTLEIVN
jgi:predicted transcriptional regulator